MFDLSVCADTFFADLPFIERAREISRAGFFVDIWRWMERDVDALASDSSIRIRGMTGYVAGSLVHPDGLETFLSGIEETIEVAKKLRCKNLVISTGELDLNGQIVHEAAAHPATMWITAYKGLCRIAELAEKNDLVYSLEHLNTKTDHPRYRLPKVEDAARLLEEVGSSRLRLLMDTYHTQVEEGNVIQTIRDFGHLAGYVHVADVPGRHEPGTGEMNYPSIAKALKEVGYKGVVALEAYPKADPHTAMNHFREIFSNE